MFQFPFVLGSEKDGFSFIFPKVNGQLVIYKLGKCREFFMKIYMELLTG